MGLPAHCTRHARSANKYMCHDKRKSGPRATVAKVRLAEVDTAVAAAAGGRDREDGVRIESRRAGIAEWHAPLRHGKGGVPAVHGSQYS